MAPYVSVIIGLLLRRIQRCIIPVTRKFGRKRNFNEKLLWECMITYNYDDEVNRDGNSEKSNTQERSSVSQFKVISK